MNNKNIFNINRIRLVAHGGNHNDTIVTVSVKTKPIKSSSVIEHDNVTKNSEFEQMTLW